MTVVVEYTCLYLLWLVQKEYPWHCNTQYIWLQRPHSVIVSKQEGFSLRYQTHSDRISTTSTYEDVSNILPSSRGGFTSNKSCYNSVHHLLLQDVEVKNNFLCFVAKFDSIASNGTRCGRIGRVDKGFPTTEQHWAGLHFRLQLRQKSKQFGHLLR